MMKDSQKPKMILKNKYLNRQMTHLFGLIMLLSKWKKMV